MQVGGGVLLPHDYSLAIEKLKSRISALEKELDGFSQQQAGGNYTKCPTCGGDCEISGDSRGEGTRYFIPKNRHFE